MFGTSYNLRRDWQQRLLKCIYDPHTSMAIVHVFISVHFPSSPITKVPEPVRKLSASLCSLCIRQKNDAQSPQFSKGRGKQRITVVNCKRQTASSSPGLQRFFFWILISEGRRVHFCLSGSSHELAFFCVWHLIGVMLLGFVLCVPGLSNPLWQSFHERHMTVRDLLSPVHYHNV